MKKTIYLTLALCAIFAITLAGCGGGDGTPIPPTTTYTVAFESNGGSAVAPAPVLAGATVIKPANPTKSGYTFAGWYSDSALTTPWDFNADVVTTNITLYAKWTSGGSHQVTVTFAPGATGVTRMPTTNPVTITNNTALGGQYPSQIPERPGGWEFTGWFNSGQQYTSSTVINTTAATFTLTAGWKEEEEYVVQYAQAPDIHPGRDLAEKYPDGLTVKKGVEFTIELTASNVEVGGGVLSAQWYRAVTEENGWDGEPVGAVQTPTDPVNRPFELTPKYTGSEPEAGEFWYWVVVTNYNENATIQKTNTKRTQYQLKVTVTE